MYQQKKIKNMKLYHATFKKNLKKIEKNGLGNTKKRLSCWDYSDYYKKQIGVFLSTDPYNAESFAEVAADEMDCDDHIIIFEVDTKDINIELLFNDEINRDEDNPTYFYAGVIKNYKIICID